MTDSFHPANAETCSVQVPGPWRIALSTVSYSGPVWYVERPVGTGVETLSNLGYHSEAAAQHAIDVLDVLENCADTLESFVRSGMAAPDSVVGKNAASARAAIARATP